ncbi:hypothetical protein M8J75_002637 [Diaphorina citri]|nr:hypothetical protein M8J75_002637 [Diaphorina citri]
MARGVASVAPLKSKMTEAENSVELENSLHNSNSQHENGNNSNDENNDYLETISGSENCDSFENQGLSSQSNNEGDNDSSSSSRKMFECDVCNMKFSNGANMRRHKMRHTGVKPYECRVCQKRFFRKDHLAEHFTTHTKTLPYHCPICNRGFQRQIAMRAHFQNEHVGQNDMIKSCPLCSYRAGSMKNLRVHFLNSHGIDLDNPGPSMMNNPAVAAASLMSGGEVGIVSTQSNNVLPPGGFVSDSGDSVGNRSADNTTPPMHFLMPHVEISMAEASSPQPKFKADSSFASITMSNEKLEVNGDGNDCPSSPQSGDSNSNTPSNSLPSEVSPITPSVSLIPIKQEPEDDKSNGSTSSVQASSNNLNNLMKSSPLKTLLREDLKRRTGLSFSCTTPSRSSSPPDSNWRCSNLKKNFSSSLQCFFCGILFPDQTLYFLHKGCHCESNPWRCNICGEQLFNVYEFNSHLLSKTHQ